MTTIPSIKKALALFLVISLIILFKACTTENPAPRFVVKEGLIYDSQGTLFSGIIKDSLMNKVVEFEVLDGVKEGIYKVYSMNGRIEISGLMKSNMHDGKWIYYYPGGGIESEGIFRNDLLEDKWNWYYENGSLKETGFFRNGKREGPWYMYDEKGEIIDYGEFLNDQRKIIQKN